MTGDDTRLTTWTWSFELPVYNSQFFAFDRS